MPHDPIAAKVRRTAEKIRLLKNWYEFVLPETRFTHPQDTVFRLRNGLYIHTRNGSWDLPILIQMFERNIYGDFRNFSGTGPCTILDIGGHIGMFALYASWCIPGARLHSYEPDPQNHLLFRENIGANRLNDRVTLHTSAVCKTRGTRRLFVNPSNTSMNNLYGANEARGMRDTINVPCTTLDDILHETATERFDIAKIDCEGAEYEILFSASDTALRALPYLIVEWHKNTEHCPRELDDFLKTKGYETTYSEKPRIITARHQSYA